MILVTLSFLGTIHPKVLQTFIRGTWNSESKVEAPIPTVSQSQATCFNMNTNYFQSSSTIDKDYMSTINVVHFRGGLCNDFELQMTLDFHCSYLNHTMSKFHELKCLSLLMDLLIPWKRL